jgi:hypothetical protein
MIDKYELQQAIRDLKTIDEILEVIDNTPEVDKKIQVWLGNENTVPMRLWTTDDITEIIIPINNFGKDMEITFEEYND